MKCDAIMAKYIREGYSAWAFAKICDRGKEKRQFLDLTVETKCFLEKSKQ